MSLDRLARRGGLMTLALVLGACGTQVQELYRDPDFRAGDLEEEGLVVGGITVVDESADPDLALDYGSALTRVLRKAREWSSLKGPGEALLAGDVDTYREILADYRHTARLDAEALGELAPVRRMGRYLLMGRLDVDEIERTHEETRDDQADRVRFEVELLTRRHVGVTFDLFDLELRRIVWSATLDRRVQVRGERFTHETYPEQMQDSAIEELAEIRERIRQLGHPPPPKRSEVLEHIYGDLEEALPGG